MRVVAWGSNLFGQLGTEGRLTHAAPVDLGHERVVGMTRAAIVRGSGAEGPRCLVGVDQVIGQVDAEGRAWHGGAAQRGSPHTLWRSVAADMRGRIVGIAECGSVWQFESAAAWLSGAGERLDTPPCVAVAGGGAHFVLITEGDRGASRVYALGDNRFGQLGDLDLGRVAPAPVSFFSAAECFDARIVQVCAGSRHSVALADDGNVYVWGWDAVLDCALEPTPVLLDDAHVDVDVVEVACGASHTLLRLADGAVWGFGTDAHSELGGQGDVPSDAPRAVHPGMPRALRIHACGWTSVAEVEQ